MRGVVLYLIFAVVFFAVGLITWAAEEAGQPETTVRQQGGRFQELPLPANVEMLENVVYGKGGERDLKLYLFLPKDERERHPAVVFFHGGGWTGGTPKQFFPQAGYLASKGYVCASAEYRLSGEAKFPAAVEDVKCAVRWMRANAEKYKIDPNRIAASGGSAGAHLAALLGVMDKADDMEGTGGHEEYSSKVNAVVAFNGVFDLTGIAQRFEEMSQGAGATGPARFFGSKEAYEKGSPIRYVNKGDAAFLLLHGTADQTVPFEQAVKMKKALEEAGVRAELFTAEGAAHGFFNNSPWYEPTLKRMEEFLNDVFGWKTEEKPREQ